MRKVEFVPFWLTDKVEIFAIKIDDKQGNEAEEFIEAYQSHQDQYISDDYYKIFQTLQFMASEGIGEHLFRPEGKLNDRVCALPLLIRPRDKSHGTLRLYCIRVSDGILILGGGGIKKTQSYQEDKDLDNKVQTLQKIDKELTRLEDEGIEICKEIYNLVIHIQ